MNNFLMEHSSAPDPALACSAISHSTFLVFISRSMPLHHVIVRATAFPCAFSEPCFFPPSGTAGLICFLAAVGLMESSSSSAFLAAVGLTGYFFLICFSCCSSFECITTTTDFVLAQQEMSRSRIPRLVWPSYNSPNVSNRGKCLDWNLLALGNDC
jgi:hypothetical protein